MSAAWRLPQDQKISQGNRTGETSQTSRFPKDHQKGIPLPDVGYGRNSSLADSSLSALSSQRHVGLSSLESNGSPPRLHPGLSSDSQMERTWVKLASLAQPFLSCNRAAFQVYSSSECQSLICKTGSIMLLEDSRIQPTFVGGVWGTHWRFSCSQVQPCPHPIARLPRKH